MSYKEDASTIVDEILQDVEAMFASFAYYFKSGDQHSINSATYLLPPGLPGAVILDATANNDVLYQMLKGRVYIAADPSQRTGLQQRDPPRGAHRLRPWEERRG